MGRQDPCCGDSDLPAAALVQVGSVRVRMVQHRPAVRDRISVMPWLGCQIYDMIRSEEQVV